MKTWQVSLLAAVVSLLAGALGAVLGAVIGFGLGLLVLEGCRDRAECEDMWLFATAGVIVFGLGAAVMAWSLVRRMPDRRKPG
jgi:hypothetical protein